MNKIYRFNKKGMIVILTVLMILSAAYGQTTWNTATSEDESYNWPMIGNGSLQTIVGPNGYHNGKVLDVESVNRAIFWAGRRHRDARSANTWIPRFDKDIPIGSTQPLVRFGRISRYLSIDGTEVSDENWVQTLDYDHGVVKSTLDHGSLLEHTESMVLMDKNILVFHTTLTNTSNQAAQAEFKLKYEFGDAYGEQAAGTRLFVFRPYPSDKLFGSVDGKFSTDPDVPSRPPHVLEGLSIKYEVEDHLGEVRWGRYPVGTIQKTGTGGNFIHELRIGGGETRELWFWVVISDRQKYTYFPQYEEVLQYVQQHKNSWQSFWNASSIKLGEPVLEQIYKSALYTLRCNSGEWSSSCGILASNWEGRFLHDEMFVFFGLISANHPELARKIPNWRRNTYDHAVQRSKGHGTFYAWEATEEGRESAPIGQWVDERYIHGEISEHVWRYYLYTGDTASLAEFYPVLKGNVEWLIYDVLRYDGQGNPYLRGVVPPIEHVYPAENCMYTICAFSRALDNACKAAVILGKDEENIKKWSALSRKLKTLLPVDPAENVYRIAANLDDSIGVAHLGSIFPFAIDIHGDIAGNTLKKAIDYYQKSKDQRMTDFVLSTTTWIWGLSNLAQACFVSGEGEKGYNILKDAKYTIGSFMTPPEHWNQQDGAYLPWHTTGAGAYVAAVNGMFVQLYHERGAVIFPAISPELSDVEFKRLLAGQGVAVSGKIENGKITRLLAHAPRDMVWTCRLPVAVAQNLEIKDNIIKVEKEDRFIILKCNLQKGENPLID